MKYLPPAAFLLMLFVGLLLLMRWGWKKRADAQSGIAPLPQPAFGGKGLSWGAVPDMDCTYVSTTSADQPLERIVAHGLGSRARARITVGYDEPSLRDTFMIDREGSPTLYIPFSAVRTIRTAPGAIGKWMGGDGLIMIGWTHEGTDLDTYLRMESASDHDRLLSYAPDSQEPSSISKEHA